MKLAHTFDGEIIKMRRLRLEWSRSELSRLSNINYSTLLRIERNMPVADSSYKATARALKYGEAYALRVAERLNKGRQV